MVVRILLQICGMAKPWWRESSQHYFRYHFKEEVNETSINRFTESRRTF